MMSKSRLWALLPDLAEETLRELAREAGTAENPATPQSLSHTQGNISDNAPYSIENGVAIISVNGPIDRKARISFWTGLPYTAGQNFIHAAIESALADREARAILLSIDSPGGVVSGTKELADYIAGIREQKPIAAYADGLCASAAYWLASATGTIYAPVTAQVGSIGVIAVLTDWSKAADKAGISRSVIYSGKWKAAGSPDKPLTDEEREIFQERLAALHEIFISDVARNLNLSLLQMPQPAWAEGQTFLGREALELGLVSKLVQDRAEAVSSLAAKIQMGESFVNLTELKTSHPELVKELAAELAASSETATSEAIEKAKAETLALVSAIGGDEFAQKAKTLLAANITSAQMQILAPMLAQPKVVEPDRHDDAEAKARAEMLESIKAATPAPVQAGTERQAPNRLMADAERRAQAARSY